jgi:hypothetical protein
MTRTYTQVGNKVRAALIQLLEEEKLTIRDASKQMNLNYENAKAIYRTYRL